MYIVVAPGGLDLCGSEKFHELDLIVSLDEHPSLTPPPKLPFLNSSQLRSESKHSPDNTTAWL